MSQDTVAAQPRRTGPPRHPRRRTIAGFADYADAQRAVDGLADRRFPVEHVAIIARDQAAAYDVQVDEDWADDAARVLAP